MELEIKKPDWLDSSELFSIVQKILFKLDKQPASERTRDIIVNLSSQEFFSLREPPQHGDDEWLWHQIEEAISDGVFVFEYGKKTIFESFPTSGKLRFLYESEDRLRVWLDHPRPCSGEAWEAALHAVEPTAINIEFLRENRIEIDDMQASEILATLPSIKQLLEKSGPKTLRHIAAIYFKGASKALDGRGDWLVKAIRVTPELIMPRKVHLTAFTQNPDARSVLFIENLDTFETCCSNDLFSNQFILVYLAGYRGTSERIRNQDLVRIFVSGNCSQSVAENCIVGTAARELFVWTDLDYSGLDIAISLKKSYPELQFLSKAYRYMTNLLEGGSGHSIEHASKGDQRPPNQSELWGIGTHCLEVIKRKKTFVDQEAVNLDDLTYQ